MRAATTVAAMAFTSHIGLTSSYWTLVGEGFVFDFGVGVGRGMSQLLYRL